MDEDNGSIYVTYPSEAENAVNGKIYQLMYLPRSYSGIFTVPNVTAYVYKEAMRGGALTEFRITSNKLTSIGDYALADCANLEYVDLHSYQLGSVLEHLGEGVFENCVSLHSWEAGSGTTEGRVGIDNVSSMGKGVFKGCTSITSASWNTKNLSQVPDSTFEGCTSLKQLSFATSLTETGYPITSFGSRCFAGCTGITTTGGSLATFSGLTSIGEECYDGCSNMSLLILPTSLTDMGTNALRGCDSLEVIAMSTTTPLSLINAGIDKTVWSSLGAYVPQGCKDVYLAAWNQEGMNSPGNIVDPSEKYRAISGNIYGCVDPTWTSYGTGDHPGLVFAGATAASINGDGLVSIYNSGIYRVTEIGANALEGNQSVVRFIGCRTASSGAVSSTSYVVKIGDSAFKNCNNLNYAYFSPSNTTYSMEIGDSAFEGCSSLPYFSLRAKTTSIGARAFAGTMEEFIVDATRITNPANCTLGANIFGDEIPVGATIMTNSSYTQYFIPTWGRQLQEEYKLTDQELLDLFPEATEDMLKTGDQNKSEILPTGETAGQEEQNPETDTNETDNQNSETEADGTEEQNSVTDVNETEEDNTEKDTETNNQQTEETKDSDNAEPEKSDTESEATESVNPENTDSETQNMEQPETDKSESQED